MSGLIIFSATRYDPLMRKFFLVQEMSLEIFVIVSPIE